MNADAAKGVVIMLHRVHWIAAAVLVLAGLVCLLAGADLVGKVLMVAGCAAYAVGIALAPRLQAHRDR